MEDFAGVHRQVTCRFCGAQGRESADDPAPGVCPDCLEAAMAAAMDRLAERIQQYGLPLAMTKTGLELVTDVGLTTEAAIEFLRQVGAVITGRVA